MSKRNYILIILIFSLFCIIIPLKTRGFFCEVINFSSNKIQYYYDERVELNANWELYYDLDHEYSFVQVLLCYNNDTMIWNSSKVSDIGVQERNWIIDLQILFPNCNDSYTELKLKFFYYMLNNEAQILIEDFKIIRFIDVFRRVINCTLYNFNDNLNYGERLSFLAQFETTLNNEALKNQIINLTSENNDLELFHNSYLTDNNGFINITLSSIEHLKIGENRIYLTLDNDSFSSHSRFEYLINLRKIALQSEVISYDPSINSNRAFCLKVVYFYYFNNSLSFLSNESIEIIVRFNNLILKQWNQNTNASGILSIANTISFNDVNKGQKSLLLILKFNGTLYIENHTTSFLFTINNDESFFYTSLYSISLGSFSILLIALILITIYKKRKSSYKTLKDLTFKF